MMNGWKTWLGVIAALLTAIYAFSAHNWTTLGLLIALIFVAAGLGHKFKKLQSWMESELKGSSGASGGGPVSPGGDTAAGPKVT